MDENEKLIFALDLNEILERMKKMKSSPESEQAMLRLQESIFWLISPRIKKDEKND